MKGTFMAVTLKRPSESCTQGLSEGAPLIRVFGAIAVRSTSGARKRVQQGWRAREGSGGEDGGERRSGKAPLRLQTEPPGEGFHARRLRNDRD